MRGVRAAMAACAWRPIVISSGTEMSTSAAATAAGRNAIAALKISARRCRDVTSRVAASQAPPRRARAAGGCMRR